MISYSVVYFIAVLLIITAPFTSAQRDESLQECTEHGNTCIHVDQCPLFHKIKWSSEERALLWRRKCGLYYEKKVCCPRPYITTVEEQTPHNRKVSVPEPGICGKTISNRIYSGSETKLDEFPWMALIFYYTNNTNMGHLCGGSLINARYVLTAAHCVKSPIIPAKWVPTEVRLGEWDTSTDIDCEEDARNIKNCSDPHVNILIEKIIIHPNFVWKVRKSQHDIALLRLSRIVTYTKYIRPICLPIKESLKYMSYDNIAMDIAGWGQTEREKMSKVKLKTKVTGIALQGCVRLYEQFYKVKIEDSQICAGGEIGVDSCKGDSGGALTALDVSNKAQPYNYIAGITSFGPNSCGLKGWPSVYTKVSSYIDWIMENIRA